MPRSSRGQRPRLCSSVLSKQDASDLCWVLRSRLVSWKSFSFACFTYSTHTATMSKLWCYISRKYSIFGKIIGHSPNQHTWEMKQSINSRGLMDAQIWAEVEGWNLTSKGSTQSFNKLIQARNKNSQVWNDSTKWIYPYVECNTIATYCTLISPWDNIKSILAMIEDIME